ncbi:MAG: hypothetical protein J6B29_02845 [Clostridia bacterium]|nr:hypothetical protein [Clostridia bacterium]
MNIAIIVSCLLSLVFALTALSSFFYLGAHTGKRKKFSFGTLMSFALAFLLLSIWAIRFAVGIYIIYDPTVSSCVKEDYANLDWWEEIFNSGVHALQTLSMDEDYTFYISNGEEMIKSVFSSSPELGAGLAVFYGIYATLLNFLAPIAGGAVVFAILSKIFVRVRLFTTYLWPFRRVYYYFSTLNERSFALAKSILKNKSKESPVIIFTDVYDLDESGIDTDLIEEVKLYGAICIKDNIHLAWKNWWGKRVFFLIQDEESKNLRELTYLTNEANYKYLKGTDVYLFSQNDGYMQIESKVKQKLREDYDFTEDELPIISPIQCYRNLITNMLEDVPLYEPLIGKRKGEDGKMDLTVTILGTGAIGTEMFLTTYWIGQMLDVNLKINVVSQEKRSAFEGKIDYLNPEIRRTANPDDDILKYNDEGEKSPPYFTMKYYECDVKSTKFIELLNGDDDGKVSETDYFFVALGSDSENMAIAETVKKYIGAHHINKDSGNKTVITYVIYDSDLANALNERKRSSSKHNGVNDIYMRAVGSLDEVYSVQNVFMANFTKMAKKTDGSYMSKKNKKIRTEENKKRIKDDYNYWSSLARILHIKYKVFSLNLLSVSVFETDETDPKYIEGENGALEVYRSIVKYSDTDEEKEKKAKICDRLAWLEHRRWCAFIRVKGFRNTDQYCLYAGEPGKRKGAYKQMELLLHPCLRECDEKGMHPMGEGTDYLDKLTYDLYSKGLNGYDFKMYDYPDGDM